MTLRNRRLCFRPAALSAIVALALWCGNAVTHAAPQPALIDWQPWSDQAFARAKKEHRFVLLYLEAVWCHWCHVMDANTWRDPKVAETLRKHYLALRVDHDARPDLANRYRAWGWPATVIYAPDGTELVKRAGYIAPEDFLRLIQDTLKNPKPEAMSPPRTVAGSPELPGPLRRKLLQRYFEAHDTEKGGLKTAQKFLDRDSTEYAMFRANVGDQASAARAQQTLTAALALLDPAWGGFYQYSTGGDWKKPHYEKIMRVQAGYLRAYALAYLQWPNGGYLKAARRTRDYLRDFLTSPEGAFYTSQDADLVQGEHADAYFALADRARRKQGLPRVDTHRYAQENGWAIEALATLYRAERNPADLEAALRAARWIMVNRGLQDGGFRHDARDNAGPFLGDTLAMGGAFLALYHVTAERQWLGQATRAGQFIVTKFRNDTAGFNGSAAANGPLAPAPVLEENIRVTRFLNLLAHYSGKQDFLKQAQHGMRFISRPEIVEAAFEESGILLADDELGRDPLHVTVVGHKDDKLAKSLFATALGLPGAYQRIEWWDRREGPLPHADVEYPGLPKAAAFVCTNKRCSSPAFEPERLRLLLQDSAKQD
jgi:uncharacterized protein YyaL (SSP411 family)